MNKMISSILFFFMASLLPACISNEEGSEIKISFSKNKNIYETMNDILIVEVQRDKIQKKGLISFILNKNNHSIYIPSSNEAIRSILQVSEENKQDIVYKKYRIDMKKLIAALENSHTTSSPYRVFSNPNLSYITIRATYGDEKEKPRAQLPLSISLQKQPDLNELSDSQANSSTFTLDTFACLGCNNPTKTGLYFIFWPQNLLI